MNIQVLYTIHVYTNHIHTSYIVITRPNDVYTTMLNLKTLMSHFSHQDLF